MMLVILFYKLFQIMPEISCATKSSKGFMLNWLSGDQRVRQPFWLIVHESQVCVESIRLFLKCQLFWNDKLVEWLAFSENSSLTTAVIGFNTAEDLWIWSLWLPHPQASCWKPWNSFLRTQNSKAAVVK